MFLSFSEKLVCLARNRLLSMSWYVLYSQSSRKEKSKWQGKEEKLTIVYKIMNKEGHTFSKQRTIDDTP